MTPAPTAGTAVVLVGLVAISMLVVALLGLLTYSRRHSRARTAVGADGPGWRTYGARLTATQASDLEAAGVWDAAAMCVFGYSSAGVRLWFEDGGREVLRIAGHDVAAVGAGDVESVHHRLLRGLVVVLTDGTRHGFILHTPGGGGLSRRRGKGYEAVAADLASVLGVPVAA